MYGYQSDASTPTLAFGLNQKCKLIKFEFNANGGKDNAPQDCLEIVFETPTGVKSYRQFPVTSAKTKDGKDTTDPNSPEMKKAFKEFNQKVSQIMLCFMTADEMQDALTGVSNFRSFCDALSNALPNGYSEIELDIFAQYTWMQKEGQTYKYLEIPSKVSQGKVFTPHVEGNFKEVRVISETELTYDGEVYPCTIDGSVSATINDKVLTFNEKKALVYAKETETGFELHPITRTKWFLDSNWAKANNDEVSEGEDTSWD